MKYLKIFINLSLILLIISCGTVKDAFQNQKKNSSDEFLVEKKSPLVMPPDYEKLPIPQQNNEDSKSKETTIKKLITNNDASKTEKNEGISNKIENFEKSILEKIKNN
ncbi:DUF3035 domain-containing protein [Candidatus Pelagibacter sp.]|nr:DUF3035 domain-containing protein [Candidatus Pelagibacter sp.]